MSSGELETDRGSALPHARSIWLLTGGFVAVTVACSVLVPQAPPAIKVEIPWPVFALGFLLGHLANIRIEFRSSHQSVDLTDATMLAAIVFSGSVEAASAAALATAFYCVVVRRRPPIKAGFSTALHAMTIMIAALVFHALLGSSSALSLPGAGAALAALIVAELLTHSGIQVAIALSAGRRPDVLAEGSTLAILLCKAGIDASLGLAALHLFSVSLVGGALLVLLAVGVGFEYAAHGRLRIRHTRLRQLYQFERALAGLVESNDVIGAVLAEALKLFNAEVAQLVAKGSVQAVAYTLRAGAVEPVATAGSHPFAELIEEEHSLLFAGASNGRLADALRASGFRDAIALRLPTEEENEHPAFLVVANRLGGATVTFGPADLSLAETLAAPTAMALRSSDLLNKLREEIASKEHQATHDPLTGLANRILVSRELDEALARRSTGALVGVMVVDMDAFKTVNDGFGHEAGDAFLQVVARRMATTVGERGRVGRLGGDEFAVVVPYARHPAEIATIAADLDIAIRAPVELGTVSVERRASIGVTVAPHHGSARSDLLRGADLAMYTAKQHGGGVVVFSPGQARELDRPSLLAALREALRTSTLDLCYQPKVSFETGRVVGVEALLRWTHPVLGPITPDQFIPVAESSGLIRPLTRWVLATALAQCSMWHQQGLDLHVAVNLSPTQLDDPEVVTQVRQLLDAHRLSPGSLVLEITESGALADQAIGPSHVLEPLAELGVQLSIDDFGVGTSSLARIKHLPVREVKIDKSFITDLAPDSVDEAIVASTINLAHQLGLAVVAEGVEKDTTYHQLALLGCDVAQGHLVSVPLRTDDLAAWLQSATAEHDGGRRWGSSSYRRMASS